MTEATQAAILYTWENGQVVEAGTRYFIPINTGENPDEFRFRVAMEAERLGYAPFIISEKPPGTPVYGTVFLMTPLTATTIPPEFWRV